MRHRWIASALVAMALAHNTAPLRACGDKLLVLGRAVRFQSRHTPRAAAVLLYLPQTGSSRLTDPNIESALREAGHTIRAVTTAADLDTALKSGSYDVVLANFSDASDLARLQTVTQQNAIVLPAVYLVSPTSPQQKPQAKVDRTKAEGDFSVVIEVPSRPGYYCAAVDKAMELKLKREKSRPT